MKKAFTLIELLVVLSIIAILAGLIYSAAGSAWTYEGDGTPNSKGNKFTKQPAFSAQVVRKYDTQESYSSNRAVHTVLHVDVKRQGSDFVESLITDSYTVFANLSEDKWYTFHVVGVRNEYWELFPKIESADKIPDQNR